MTIWGITGTMEQWFVISIGAGVALVAVLLAVMFVVATIYERRHEAQR